jgi:hypothetical protein
MNATSQKLFSTPSTVMAQREHKDDPPAKRRKLDHEEVATTEHQTKTQKGLDRTISPPLSRRRSPERDIEPTWGFDDVPKQTLVARPLPASKAEERPASEEDDRTKPHVVPSPINLTRIAGLAAHQNVDAVGLGDLLGDPLIKECWNFNFLFDLDFVMYVDASMCLCKSLAANTTAGSTSIAMYEAWSRSRSSTAFGRETIRTG